MARLQGRKKEQRFEIYPNPLMYVGTVELPAQMKSWVAVGIGMNVLVGGFAQPFSSPDF